MEKQGRTERKQYIMRRDDLEEKLKMCIFAPFFSAG